MAKISLGELKDLWKIVSDWVHGQSTDSPTIKAIPHGCGHCVADKVTVTTPGTLVPLPNREVTGVYFVANVNNTSMVYVIPSEIADKTKVVPLTPGDSIFWPTSNLSMLKIDADTANDSIYYYGVSQVI